MKKLYFQKSQLMMQFITLCKSNSIQFNLPKNTGTLLCVEIPDTLEVDEFLYKNGFED